VSARRNGERSKEGQCSETARVSFIRALYNTYKHPYLHFSIKYILILQSGKVTREQPLSVQAHSQISVVQVFRHVQQSF